MDFIETVWGRGYVFENQPTKRSQADAARSAVIQASPAPSAISTISVVYSATNIDRVESPARRRRARLPGASPLT